MIMSRILSEIMKYQMVKKLKKSIFQDSYYSTMKNSYEPGQY